MGWPETLAQDGQGLGRVVRGEVEEDDVVGGVPVCRDLSWPQQVRHDVGDVRGARIGVSRVSMPRILGVFSGYFSFITARSLFISVTPNSS